MSIKQETDAIKSVGDHGIKTAGIAREHVTSKEHQRMALEQAQNEIDGMLEERLGDGSIMLLKCSWLVSPESDAGLGRDAETASS